MDDRRRNRVPPRGHRAEPVRIRKRIIAMGWIVDGAALPNPVGRAFTDPEVAFLHADNARRGCYACRVERG